MRAIPHQAQREPRGHARGVQRKSDATAQTQVSPLPTALSKMPAEVTLQPVACPCLAPCARQCSPFLIISRSCPSLPSLAPTQRSSSTMRFDSISLFLLRRALSLFPVRTSSWQLHLFLLMRMAFSFTAPCISPAFYFSVAYMLQPHCPPIVSPPYRVFFPHPRTLASCPLAQLFNPPQRTRRTIPTLQPNAACRVSPSPRMPSRRSSTPPVSLTSRPSGPASSPRPPQALTSRVSFPASAPALVLPPLPPPPPLLPPLPARLLPPPPRPRLPSLNPKRRRPAASACLTRRASVVVVAMRRAVREDST